MRLVLLLCVVCSLPLQAATEQNRPTNVLELFGGSENLEILAHAEQVDACLLRYVKPKISEDEYTKLNSEKSVRLIYDSFREDEHRNVPAAMSADIRKKLLSEDTYNWRIKRDCPPEYGSCRLRFFAHGKVLKLTIIFECKLFEIHLDDKPIHGAYFDHDGGVLLRSMQTLFPEDLVLQVPK